LLETPREAEAILDMASYFFDVGVTSGTRSTFIQPAVSFHFEDGELVGIVGKGISP